jgi:uncharacterized ferritin-like protein (DUF455 family)
MELRALALAAFQSSAPIGKAQAARSLEQVYKTVHIDTNLSLDHVGGPGRPARPALVEHTDVPRRSPFTAIGHAALIHSIAHIEFNAIDLALDCVWRFSGLPEAFYRDWARVACEEAHHFMMLESHLQSLGFRYGDFAAHTGLWTMCENTANDVVARMALVPRTLEARGLDATPLIQSKLTKVGSPQALQAHAILQIILDEEIGHVATGNYWYRWLCDQNQLDADAFYAQSALRYGAPRPKPPLNVSARLAAGFTEAEIASLQSGS